MRQLEFLVKHEPVRFVLNGLFATAIHFTVLSILMSVVNMPSAGLANFCAAIFGISASFIGSRYLVFKSIEERLMGQLTRFVVLYGFIALIHGGFLYFWSDVFGLDYRVGFLFATGIQVSMSYMGNKFLVFDK